MWRGVCFDLFLRLLCRPGGPRAHFVEQAGLELIDLFASRELGLKLHARSCLREAQALGCCQVVLEPRVLGTFLLL